jgi:hypothetical protein
VAEALAVIGAESAGRIAPMPRPERYDSPVIAAEISQISKEMNSSSPMMRQDARKADLNPAPEPFPREPVDA